MLLDDKREQRDAPRVPMTAPVGSRLALAIDPVDADWPWRAAGFLG